MKCKSPKLILGIILLVIAIIVWLTNLTSYWIAIALAAIGLILIISRSSDNPIKKETLVEEPVEEPVVEIPAPEEEPEEEEPEEEEPEEEKTF